MTPICPTCGRPYDNPPPAPRRDWKNPTLGIVAVLIAGVALGLLGGCQSLATAEPGVLAENANTVVTTLRDSGFEGDFDVFLSPNGAASLGPAITYSNGSYIKLRGRIDPAKAKFQSDSAAP